MTRRLGFLIALGCTALLIGCSSQMADDAAAAKTKMPGMSKEDVLACMGPPKQKAHTGKTEVWSYASGNGHTNGYGNSYKFSGDTVSYASRDKSACTVNIVMQDEHVTAVHYNGPRSSMFSPDDQCGYAVEHCARGD